MSDQLPLLALSPRSFPPWTKLETDTVRQLVVFGAVDFTLGRSLADGEDVTLGQPCVREGKECQMVCGIHPKIRDGYHINHGWGGKQRRMACRYPLAMALLAARNQVATHEDRVKRADDHWAWVNSEAGRSAGAVLTARSENPAADDRECRRALAAAHAIVEKLCALGLPTKLLKEADKAAADDDAWDDKLRAILDRATPGDPGGVKAWAEQEAKYEALAESMRKLDGGAIGK